MDIQKTRYKRRWIFKKRAIKGHSHSLRITCNKSAVSLLESREQRYLKTINIQQNHKLKTKLNKTTKTGTQFWTQHSRLIQSRGKEGRVPHNVTDQTHEQYSVQTRRRIQSMGQEGRVPHNLTDQSHEQYRIKVRRRIQSMGQEGRVPHNVTDQAPEQYSTHSRQYRTRKASAP